MIIMSGEMKGLQKNCALKFIQIFIGKDFGGK